MQADLISKKSHLQHSLEDYRAAWAVFGKQSPENERERKKKGNCWIGEAMVLSHHSSRTCESVSKLLAQLLHGYSCQTEL